MNYKKEIPKKLLLISYFFNFIGISIIFLAIIYFVLLLKNMHIFGPQDIIYTILIVSMIGVISLITSIFCFIIGRGIKNGRTYARLVAPFFFGVIVIFNIINMFRGKIFYPLIFIIISVAIIFYLSFNEDVMEYFD
jgi:hypothetical protein